MADVDLALTEFFADVAYTDTVTPDELEELIVEHGGVIRVRRVGGGGDADNDTPRVSVQHFAFLSDDQPRAHFDLAQATEALLFDVATYGPQKVGGLVIEAPVKESGPIELTYDNPAVKVTESIFRITTRR